MESTVELLVSCMGIRDFAILETTNVQCNVLLVDQCGKDDLIESSYKGFRVRHLKSSQRGLSRSRNTAIENARCEIGLLCDDDEHLVDGYPHLIARTYGELEDADIICFRIENKPRRLKPRVQRIGKSGAFRIGSWQISMKIDAVRTAGVKFDVLLGAGTGNGAGEETKFLRDCIDAGLMVYYVPLNIGTVGTYQLNSAKTGESTWFTGFNEEFFFKKGATVRYILGLPATIPFAFYHVMSHKELYKWHISQGRAISCIIRGAFANPIGKQAKAASGETEH